MKTKNIIIGAVIVFAIIIIATYVIIRKSKGKPVLPGALRLGKDGKVRSILFIGDSNTAANFSYADQLKKRFPELNIKKIAKVGEKTDWMFNQLYEELGKNEYDVVAILGGSNDIYATGRTDRTKQSLDSMYKLAHARGSKVLAVTPPNKDFYVNKTDQKQALLYDLVEWMKRNRNIDFLVDWHKLTNNISFFNSSDGYLHANANAHSVLANQSAQKLNL